MSPEVQETQRLEEVNLIGVEFVNVTVITRIVFIFISMYFDFVCCCGKCFY
jgi:hypothetical protein